MKIAYTWNIDLINNYIRSNNLSKTQFCKKCGISTYILKKIYSCNMHIGIKIWLKIADFLEVDYLDVLKKIH